MNKQQKTLSLKIIAALILAGLSAIYLYVMMVDLPILPACVGMLLGGRMCPDYGIVLGLISLGGIFGLIGLWTLLLSKNFKNKAKRILVVVLLIIGIIAAAYVFLVCVVMGAVGESVHSVFLLAFISGLPALIIAAIVFGKIRLFPKK